MEKPQVVFTRSDGSEYGSDLAKESCFCPNCGSKETYYETAGGDYYVGVDYYCLDCKARWNMPTGYDSDSTLMFRESQPFKSIVPEVKQIGSFVSAIPLEKIHVGYH